MLARFFIDRPIFAWVISIIIVLFGGVAMFVLPIAQYPEITPPSVTVTAVYPGAAAKVVRDTVAAPIEQQVNGVENMMYMSSQSADDGSYNLTVTFELGTNLDMAQVLVQNRVTQATALLPDAVKATGVTVKKRSPAILLAVTLYSDVRPETGLPYHNQLDLSNYATINVRDELARIKGVGDVTLLGQQDYSMRIWVEPWKLAARKMTAGDVVRALKEQNVQVAAGQVGRPPTPTGQDFQYTVNTLGRLVDPKDFDNIVLKTGDNSQITRIRDIGRTDLNAKNEDTLCRLDGKPAVSLAIFQTPGSNALATADAVKKKMTELAKHFPKGLLYATVYDTTPFIRESVTEVFHTLRDAIILVAVVVLLFLQDWRSLILPLIDVGVSLVGTLAILQMCGYTLNNLTLFGLVLAIGIVVDDAIVVLENIERWLAMGYPVREATLKAMSEITGPIIAITLVLSCVFLPAFILGGITGQFYRQFALTIASAMIISAINAMTMTPARAASVFGHRQPGGHGGHGGGHGGLGGHEALPPWGVAAIVGGLLILFLESPVLTLFHIEVGHEATVTPRAQAILWAVPIGLFVAGSVIGWLIAKPVNQGLAVVFRGFNRAFDLLTEAFGRGVARGVRGAAVVMLLYFGLIGLTVFGFAKLPTGFIPEQDKGYLLMDVQLRPAASLESTLKVIEQAEAIIRKNDAVANVLSIPGQSFILNAVSSNYGSAFIILKPFHDRHGNSMSADAVLADLRKELYVKVPDARIAIFGAPPVDGLGNAGGFKLMVEDKEGDLDLDILQGQVDNLAEQANKTGALVGVFSGFRSDTPQYYVKVNKIKCKKMKVSLTEVADALQVYLGGYYVNDFNQFGRTWQVNIQAEAPFRLSADRIGQFRVRTSDGKMVPLGSVVKIEEVQGPPLITRYNMYTAAAINGASRPGVSSGQAMALMEKLSKRELPASMGYEWTELSYMEQASSKVETVADLMQNPFTAFALGVLLVFLVLAAQYESWSIPLAVILVVPMCLLCALAGIWIAHMDINIFVQIGFLVLVGLAAKNAILVVEFAKERQKAGLSALDAAVEASRSRLRPIIMTSFAFILGVVPLMLGSGAGAEMRRTLGTAVFSGMLGVTLFGLFLTPVFYWVVMWLIGQAEATPAPAPHQPPAPPASGPPQPTPVASPTPAADVVTAIKMGPPATTEGESG